MKSSIILGYLSRFLSLGSGILILPLILKGLTKEEFVFWMLFVTFSSLVNVIDFGFMATFSRFFNYVLAGATELPKNSKNIDLIKSDNVSYSLLAAIYMKAKRIYLLLSILFGFLCFVFYVFYLKRMASENGVSCLSEWLVFSIGLIISVYYLYFNALLSGLNKISVSYLATISSTVVFFILAIASHFLNYGLLGICLAKTISIAVFRVHCYIYLRGDNDFQKIEQEKSNRLHDLSIIHKGASKVGVSTLGAFLTNRASVFIIGIFLPIDQVSKFALGSYLFSTIVSVSLIAINTTSPSISRSIINKDQKKHGALFRNTFLFSNLIFLCGSFIAILGSEWVLQVLHSNTHLPDKSILLLFVIVFFFELNQQLATTYLMLNNDLSYVVPVLISGIFYVLLTATSLSISNGLIVALLCQFFAQMIYNNWYWPFYCYNLYRKNISDYS